MAERVDLDAAKANLEHWANPQIGNPIEVELATRALALVAELRELRERIDDYENAITWGTSCTSCARTLDASIADHERASKAEAELSVAREARDRLSQFYDDRLDFIGDQEALGAILAAWDVKAAGRPATADQPPGDR